MKFTDLEEADKALAEIEILSQQVSKAEADYNKKEQERKQKLLDKNANSKAKIEELSDALEHFALSNKKKYFSDSKTVELQNGVLNFRVGKPKLEFIKGFDNKMVLLRVRESEFAQRFTTVKTALDKATMLKEYSKELITDQALKELCCVVTQDETFSFKTKSAVNKLKNNLKAA